MSDHAVGKTFRLLTMSTVIFSVTLVLLVLPLGVLLATMYASHTEGFVWIVHINEHPWLITPEQPEAFVRALSA